MRSSTAAAFFASLSPLRYYYAANHLTMLNTEAFVTREVGCFRRQVQSSTFIHSPPKKMVSIFVENGDTFALDDEGDEWNDVLPFQKSSHNSATIIVPSNEKKPLFHRNQFRDRLEDTIEALRELEKSSVWVEVPMSRASLIEDMEELGFEFHHASGKTVKLNMWLRDDTESLVPEFATHHVGVGAVIVNSRDEILCVRGLRQNFMPWKIPGGLAELGEQIPEAAVREVMEETGIPTTFHSILSFRHTHGLANNRSDLFFVCRLDPIEQIDENGNAIIPTPIPQECEIEDAQWVPLAEYRDMVNGVGREFGHPMMSHVMKIFDQARGIQQRHVQSVIPGRKPSPMYHPDVLETE